MPLRNLHLDSRYSIRDRKPAVQIRTSAWHDLTAPHQLDTVENDFMSSGVNQQEFELLLAFRHDNFLHAISENQAFSLACF